MNKEVKFSIFIGVACIVLCSTLVILALMSAILKDENINNIVGVDEGSNQELSVPKSNLVTEYMNTEKEVSSGLYNLKFKVRLPKVNLETTQIQAMNSEMYRIYQDMFDYASNITDNEKIEIDYTYDYIDNDTKIEIIISKKSITDTKENVTVIKYIYDIEKDSYEVKK